MAENGETSLYDDIEKDKQNIKDASKRVGNTAKKALTDENSLEGQAAQQLKKKIAQEAAKKAAQQAAAKGAAGAAASTGAGAAGGAAAASGGAAAGAGGAAAGAGGGVAAGAGTGAGAGAAGGPVGIVVGAVVGLIAGLIGAVAGTNSAKKKAEEASNDGPGTVGNGGIFTTIAIIAFCFMFFFCGTFLTKGISGMFSLHQETEYANDSNGLDGNADLRAEAGTQYMEGGEEYVKSYNTKQPLKNAIDLFVYGPGENGKAGDGTKQGLRATLFKALEDVPKKLKSRLKKDEKIIGKDRNEEMTMDSYYGNRYPFDLATDSFVPKIGDVYHIEGYSSDYQAKLNDVNWAEIVTIFSMSENVEGVDGGFSWGTNNFKNFEKFINEPECTDYMYEIGLKWIPLYYGEKTIEVKEGDKVRTETIQIGPIEGAEAYDSPEGCKNAPPYYYHEGVQCEFKAFYIKSIVKPFGLREEFKIVFRNEDPWKVYDKAHVNYYLHSNGFMLDYSEKLNRFYEREQSKNVGDGKVDALGPSYDMPRSQYSSIYDDLINDDWLKSKGQAGTGRSAWFYIEKTYNGDLLEIDWGENIVPDDEDNEEIDEIIKKIKEMFGNDEEKLKALFPDGIPTTPAEMQKYLKTVEISIINEQGLPDTIKLTLHKALADDAKAMIEAMCAAGLKIDTKLYGSPPCPAYGGYNWRTQKNGTGNISAHALGLAFDLNSVNNGYYHGDRLDGGGAYDPNDTESGLTITKDIAKAAEDYGWYWGGNWKSCKDYMHFGYINQ